MLGNSGAFAGPAEDTAVIANILHGMFDKPGSALQVEPVMVAGAYAVADWAQGEVGGRALLRRQSDGWTLVLCAGDGIKTPEGLTRVGVPASDAAELAEDMRRAEASLSPERVGKFSRFEGLVMMSGDTSAHAK
jgi:hypothetical protein